MEPRQSAPELPHVNQPLERGEQYSYNDRQLERAGEANREVIPAMPQVETESLPPVVVPVPEPVPPMQASAAPTVDIATSTNPASAADDDLIEKEWVDKIKKVIEATKENPYKRELEIGKLQRDYIRKRYGREIGASGDSKL